MRRFRTAQSATQQAAALLIVLAMVVLLTGLCVAYLSRTTSDRQVAHSSFHQSKVDQLAASAMDLIIGDFRTEVARGSSPTPTATCSVSVTPPCNVGPTGTPSGTPPACTPTATPFVFFPTPAANILPAVWPTTTPNTTPILNLIRVSKRGDEQGGANPIPIPGLPSHASAVNSSSPTEASANGRYVKLARWNKHYLIPRPSATLATDTNPIAAFSPAPDWVILTRNGPVAFSNWCSVLADPAQSNSFYCVGRYAYAVYDEGGLLDANVAGFPSNTTAAQYGPKGTSAFADLTVLGLSQTDIDAIVGWRNYFSAGPTGNFPNFNFNAGAASNYVAAVLSNTNGFLSVPIPSSTPNNMSNTDQQFATRQSLINLLVNSGLSDANTAAYALQYLGTFSRELNEPSWWPTLNASDMGGNNGGSPGPYSYRDNANPSPTPNPTPTPINPNLLNVRVCSGNGCGFTRADGTTANPGEPLINRRFALTRLAGLGPTGIVTTVNSTIVNGVPSPATAATIQRDFGLLWNSTSNRWDYVGPSGSNVQTSIETLWLVANENPGREPNFFELLKAAILNGSVGMGSGSSGNTFIAAEAKYWSTADTTHGTSSDYQIMQIGANIINQWDSGNVPIFIGFGSDPSTSQPYELAGIKNLPYLSKLVFKPYWSTSHGNNVFDAWLLPSLWNPHQNAPTPASRTVRLNMTLGSGAIITAYAKTPDSNSSLSSSEYMIFDASNAAYGLTPSGPTTNSVSQKSSNVIATPDNNYYGFHFPQMTLVSAPSSSSTAYPDFGTSCTFELQVDVTGNGNWKSYQKWSNCAQPAAPNQLIYSNSSSNPKNDKTIQDPEFVSLDPRTVRFGVWGNDGFASGNSTDYTVGVLNSLDESVGSPPSTAVYELIPAALTTLRPNGSVFVSATSPNLYLYANNTDNTVYYKDLDSVKRQGDAITPNYTTPMQPTDSADRSLALNGVFQNGVFQSVAELGHVYRDQPWKTIEFTSASSDPSFPMKSPDAGLLDVFTLHESSIEAGKTSLNTKQPLVLKAILGPGQSAAWGFTIKRLKDFTTAITQAQRDAIVTALQGLTPIVNKTELVTRLSSDPSVTGLGNKEARESVMRAFSDAGQTRTWNLLIDLIAQSGRYPSSANSLAGFVVEGEVHYWVHVAIDRFTGEVIDKQIEVVNE
jgi:hypothetical protein